MSATSGTSIPESVSRRINVIRFPLIIAVAFIHANNGFGIETKDPYFISSLIRNFISISVGGVAVPLFFMMSGFLLFKDFELTAASYGSKLKSRVRTLLVPYLFWNVLSFALVALLQRHGIGGAGGASVTAGSLWDISDRILGFSGIPFAFQFWYIRDLMIAVALSPILLLLVSRAMWPGIVIFTGLWVADVAVVFHSPVTLAAFFFGAAMAHKRYDAAAADRFSLPITAVYFVLGAAFAVLKAAMPGTPHGAAGVLLALMYDIVILLGLAAFWTLAPRVGRSAGVFLSRLAVFSFFVFAAHEPALTFAQRMFTRFIPPVNIAGILAYYFVPVLVTIAVVLPAGMALKRVLPGVFGFVSGGRS